jgi:hypothetical protein
MADADEERNEDSDCSSSSSLDSRDPDTAILPRSRESGGYLEAGRLFPTARPNVRHPQAADAMTSTLLPGGKSCVALYFCFTTLMNFHREVHFCLDVNLVLQGTVCSKLRL